MCLSIPSKVVELKEDNTAVVETFGARRVVSLDLLQEGVSVGDWVLVHVGFAIQKLDEEYALESLKLFEQLLEEEDEALGELQGS
ncbi:MAG: HypC/HybG/HupF family hydrogenase formation chaperone [Aquificaceae bacterium]|jgi:hydrogenase expression/formation protein HypC|uniref:HypC/HybG/HupF family hydrogenase formation chaperone n=1 Tax=Hydrogenobacter sp. Uz 6-8 TaxID=3384828 RepID=UPI000F2C583B|nr:MAG: HypC/HybG/HupF family hydrogenase formation chaperone [Aquificota bacterium]